MLKVTQSWEVTDKVDTSFILVTLLYTWPNNGCYWQFPF